MEEHEEELGRPVDYIEVAAINGFHPVHCLDNVSVDRLPGEAKAIPGVVKVVSILIHASIKRNAWVGVNTEIVKGYERAVTSLAIRGYIHYRNIAGEIHVIYPTERLIQVLVSKKQQAQLALFSPTLGARG